jgi:CRP/FNR family transcriptional regulator, dissimilatory nitrate respiration regulator
VSYRPDNRSCCSARSGFVAEASLYQPAYHCDAIAAQDSELLALPRKSVMHALTAPAFRDALFGQMADELRRLRTHNERLGLKTARERILHYLETEGRNGRLELRQTRKAWAEELGLTHEALYRALSALKEARVIAVAGETISLGPAARQ